MTLGPCGSTPKIAVSFKPWLQWMMTGQVIQGHFTGDGSISDILFYASIVLFGSEGGDLAGAGDAEVRGRGP